MGESNSDGDDHEDNDDVVCEESEAPYKGNIAPVSSEREVTRKQTDGGVNHLFSACMHQTKKNVKFTTKKIDQSMGLKVVLVEVKLG